MKKLTATTLIALALMGCEPETKEQASARQAYKQDYYTQSVRGSIYKVCMGDVTYLYHAAGNASSLTVALGPDSKIIPCKEVE